ncbi:hypothetical protein GGH96_000325 [Coemansia sp. RSA 1972]|nr:hypothetical protein GGH96_000325 [Coemansia sp. RSA 1972]
MSNVDPSVSPSDSIPNWLSTHAVNGEHVQLYVDENITLASSTGTFEPYAGQVLIYYVFNHNQEEEMERPVDSGIEIISMSGDSMTSDEDELDDGMSNGYGKRYLPVRESD